MTPHRFAPVLLLSALLGACGMETGEAPAKTAVQPTELVIYAGSDDPAFAGAWRAFERQSEVAVSVVPPDASEPMSQADVYFGATFADLWEAAERDAFRPVESSLLQRLSTLKLADPERRFLPIAATRRTAAFNTRRVSTEEIRTFTGIEELADERWRGRLCLSSSRIDGNRLLVAYLIKTHDVREAEIIVRRWLGNLAAAEFESDFALAAAIADGRCAAGILDSRWVSQPERASGDIVAAPADAGGVFDISGVGMSRHAANAEAAGEFLAWLLSRNGVNAYVADRPLTSLAGESQSGADDAGSLHFLEQAANLGELGFLLEDANRLIERAGYR